MWHAKHQGHLYMQGTSPPDFTLTRLINYFGPFNEGLFIEIFHLKMQEIMHALEGQKYENTVGKGPRDSPSDTFSPNHFQVIPLALDGSST